MSLHKAIGIGLAGALLALSAVTPSSAAPVSNGAALKQAAPDSVTDVRWRGGGGWHGGGWRGGRGVGVGVGLGLLGAGVIAGGYGPGYYGYGPYGYAPAYAYYPGPYWGPRRYYYGPRYRHRHWRHRW